MQSRWVVGARFNINSETLKLTSERILGIGPPETHRAGEVCLREWAERTFPAGIEGGKAWRRG